MGLTGAAGGIADAVRFAEWPAVDPTVGHNLAAGFEAQGLDRWRWLDPIGREARVHVAQVSGRIAGAVGVAHALLAIVLVAGNARAQVAMRAVRVIGRERSIGAVAVGEALEAVAGVAREIAEVRAGLAHPARGAGVGEPPAEDVAAVDDAGRRGAGGPAAAVAPGARGPGSGSSRADARARAGGTAGRSRARGCARRGRLRSGARGRRGIRQGAGSPQAS